MSSGRIGQFMPDAMKMWVEGGAGTLLPPAVSVSESCHTRSVDGLFGGDGRPVDRPRVPFDRRVSNRKQNLADLRAFWRASRGDA